MKLMYVARLSRPDILFCATFLATKSQKPTTGDWRDAIRIVKYLNGTQSHGIHVNCSSLDVYAHCNASYGTHKDGKGYTGYSLQVWWSNHHHQPTVLYQDYIIIAIVVYTKLSIKYLATNNITTDMLTKSLGRYQHQYKKSCGVNDLANYISLQNQIKFMGLKYGSN